MLLHSFYQIKKAVQEKKKHKTRFLFHLLLSYNVRCTLTSKHFENSDEVKTGRISKPTGICNLSLKNPLLTCRLSRFAI